MVIHHEAIFDVAKFEAINAVLDGRRLREPRSLAFYSLTGIVCCGCGAKWEPCNTGEHRYYRCTAHCGEKWRRKEALEQQVWDSFGEYLKQRQGRADYLELAQESMAKLRGELVKVERDIAANASEWRSLLEKDLAGYPAEIIEDKKAELNAARQSLEWRKAEIEGQLLLLPQVEPDEVERELEPRLGLRQVLQELLSTSDEAGQQGENWGQDQTQVRDSADALPESSAVKAAQ